MGIRIGYDKQENDPGHYIAALPTHGLKNSGLIEDANDHRGNQGPLSIRMGDGDLHAPRVQAGWVSCLTLQQGLAISGLRPARRDRDIGERTECIFPGRI